MGPKTRFVFPVILVLIAILQTAWTAKEKRVEVIVNSPKLTTHVFDPAKDASAWPVVHGKTEGMSSFAFSDSGIATFRFQKTGFQPQKIVGRITGLEVTTSLDLVIWLPEGYSKKQHDHLQGHRRLTERTYFLLADKTAREEGAKYIGLRTRAFLLQEDFKTLAQEMAKKATDKMGFEWIQVLSAEAKRVNDLFDVLTDDGRNDMPVGKAIEQALNTVRRRMGEAEGRIDAASSYAPTDFDPRPNLFPVLLAWIESKRRPTAFFTGPRRTG